MDICKQNNSVLAYHFILGKKRKVDGDEDCDRKTIDVIE